jgi:hypothetical protein
VEGIEIYRGERDKQHCGIRGSHLGFAGCQDPRYGMAITDLRICSEFPAAEILFFAGPRSLLIKGDSMLVIKQLDGSWEVHKPHLEKLRDTARSETPFTAQLHPHLEKPDA